jgi:hypothetical protein
MFQRINFRPATAEKEARYAKDYKMVTTARGKLKCSCGRELIKMDEETYKCSGGFPIYRISSGGVFIDKFGQLWLDNGTPHNPEGAR